MTGKAANMVLPNKTRHRCWYQLVRLEQQQSWLLQKCNTTSCCCASCTVARAGRGGMVTGCLEPPRDLCVLWVNTLTG